MVVHHAFRVTLRQPARHSFQHIYIFQNGMRFQYLIIPLLVRIEDIRFHRALHCADVRLLRQCLHIFFLKSQSGDKPVIIQLLRLPEGIRRPDHHRFGDLKSCKKPHPQRNDRHNGQIPPQALPDLPQCCFLHHGFHANSPFPAPIFVSRPPHRAGSFHLWLFRHYTPLWPRPGRPPPLS